MDAASGEDVRMFRLSVDVRNFKAGLRLPMKAINACVRVVLPPEIVRLAMATPNSANAAKLTAPLRTHPPVMAQKGSEVTLSNGFVSLELPASVSGLAAALAQDLCLQAQVFHRDKYAADSLIGTASIPMASLMKEPWLDGYAPVYSPSDGLQQDMQVIVGTLRVVLSAEDLGPANTSIHRPIQGTTKERAISPFPSLEDPFFLLKRAVNDNRPSKVVGVQTESQEDSDEKLRTDPYMQKSERAPKVLSKSKILKPLKGNQENLLQNPVANSDRAVPPSHADEKLRRYELEWEFDRWRRAEEAKWRAGLKDKETKRLAALDAEWKQKERERVLDVDKTRMELGNLETKFRAKLFALEKRERTLVIAEEEALLRREAWTRDCAQRAADAEVVAVKRLRSECEHRVELEKTKYTALKEQHSVLEKRLATANTALADLEKQFCTYKTEHYKTSEAELLGQVMLLKQQCNDLKRNYEQSIKTKNDYKAQVQKLAKELAKLHKQRTQDEANQRAQERGHLALQSLIDAQARKTDEERLEFRQLKEQLEQLQLHDNATLLALKTEHKQTSCDEKESKAHNSCSASMLPISGYSVVDGKFVKRGANKRNFLDEAVQVSIITDDVSASGELLKQGYSSMIHERDEFDDCFNGDFGNLDDLSHMNLSTSMFEEATIKDDGSVPILRTGLLERSSMGQQTELADDFKSFDVSFYTSQLSEFQSAEIKRLTKQRLDLLQTGVYTEEDRIIKGLDQEIQRLRSVDTMKFAI
ncbi:hypothetical protein L7F22_062877 [Adiantum nelumboides]|nr:hypothetical protein [Adiantum nelumboides]